MNHSSMQFTYQGQMYRISFVYGMAKHGRQTTQAILHKRILPETNGQHWELFAEGPVVRRCRTDTPNPEKARRAARAALLAPECGGWVTPKVTSGLSKDFRSAAWTAYLGRIPSRLSDYDRGRMAIIQELKQLLKGGMTATSLVEFLTGKVSQQ